MKINITIEIDDEELKKLFNLKPEVDTEPIEGEECNKSSPLVSEFARFFDAGCDGWTNNPETNLFYLKQIEETCNYMLRRKGYLFLNDVYDKLGIPRSQVGQMIGWIYDEEKPIGDNCVNFGIHEEYNSDFVNGYRKDCLLDFNVDGNILNLL